MSFVLLTRPLGLSIPHPPYIWYAFPVGSKAAIYSVTISQAENGCLAYPVTFKVSKQPKMKLNQTPIVIYVFWKRDKLVFQCLCGKGRRLHFPSTLCIFFFFLPRKIVFLWELYRSIKDHVYLKCMVYTVYKLKSSNFITT